MDILETIRRFQRARGWKDADLAKHAEIPQTTIASWEKRNYLPSVPTILLLCKAFDITIAQFFSESDVPPDLTPEQIELLEHWNTLPADKKEVLMQLIKKMQT